MKLSTLSTLSRGPPSSRSRAAACDPSDNLADKQMSELTDDEFLEFCEGFEAELDADTIEGQRRADCLATVDCGGQRDGGRGLCGRVGRPGARV
jgi:hypothetical protein